MEQKKNLNTSVVRHNVTMEDIYSFVNNCVVKFIFLDKDFTDISFDKNINEIHKFKSVYRGNTYVRVPLKFIKEDKYVTSIEVDTTDNPDGFAVISKHDLRGMSKELKKAKKEECVAYGEKLCKEYLDIFNKYLDNNVLEIIVKDEDNNILKTKLIPNTTDMASLTKEILANLEEVNSNLTEII